MKMDLSKINIERIELEQIAFRIETDLLKKADMIADALSKPKKNVSRNTVLNSLLDLGIKQVIQEDDTKKSR